MLKNKAVSGLLLVVFDDSFAVFFTMVADLNRTISSMQTIAALLVDSSSENCSFCDQLYYRNIERRSTNLIKNNRVRNRSTGFIVSQ